MNIVAPAIALCIIVALSSCATKSTKSSQCAEIVDSNGYLSGNDIAAIIRIVDARPEAVGSMLSIKALSKNRVEAHFGFTRGPLDGGGQIFRLTRSDGEWKIEDTGSVRIWLN